MINVLQHPEFLSGNAATDFIFKYPELLDIPPVKNRAQKLLHYIGEVMVNGPVTPLATDLKPAKITPLAPEVGYFGSIILVT